jgi:hypothetical protein
MESINRQAQAQRQGAPENKVWSAFVCLTQLSKTCTKLNLYEDDDENKPIWPTWAVGVLSGVRDVETYNRGRPSQRSLRGLSGVPTPHH